MTCPTPVFARSLGVNPETGKQIISFKGSTHPSLALPCGKCPVCLANRQKFWRRRMSLELFERGEGSFLTLTYNDEHCDGLLHKDDVQKFLKRLRHIDRDFKVECPKFTYYCAAEYGTTTKRPHYHLALFGLNLLEMQYLPRAVGYDNGYPIFSSEIIEQVWPFGFNTVGELNAATIGYVSKYLTKPSKSEFSLKSHSLGVAPFVDVTRVGRQVIYSPKSLLLDSFRRGSIVLPDSSGGFSSVGLPRNLQSYLKRLYPQEFEAFKARARDWVSTHKISVSELSSALALGERIKADNYQKTKRRTSV